MIFNLRVSAVVLILGWLGATPASAGHTLTVTHQKILNQWLQVHGQFRVAEDQDCTCPEDIQEMKRGSGGVWKPVIDYHPYAATGDFNGDGAEDFAVVLVDRQAKEKKFAFVVFNGPFKSRPQEPVFIETGLDLANQGLFFGPPRPKPYRLIVGPFESDNTALLEPKGASYRWDYADNGH